MKVWKLTILLLASSVALASVAPNFTYYHTTDVSKVHDTKR